MLFRFIRCFGKEQLGVILFFLSQIFEYGLFCLHSGDKPIHSIDVAILGRIFMGYQLVSAGSYHFLDIFVAFFYSSLFYFSTLIFNYLVWSFRLRIETATRKLAHVIL